MAKLLRLLEQDCTLTHEQLASMADMTVADVEAAIQRYEADKTILGYQAIVDWDRTDREAVTALIEVKVTPQRGDGFDRVAERIYQYDEVESVYLMSGAYDLMLEVQAESLRTLANFVSQKLATIDSVLSTATHFVLKKYKVDGVILEEEHADHRLAVTP